MARLSSNRRRCGGIVIKTFGPDFELTDELTGQCLEGLRRLKLRTDLGFLNLPFRDELWEASRSRAENLKSAFDVLVVLGIGGSSLGAKVLRDFAEPSMRSRLMFIESPEEAGLVELLGSLSDLSRVHFVAISKSGTTLESLAQLSWLVAEFRSRGLQFEQQLTVITECRSSPLYDWAQKNKVFCLEVPIDVGGRFSVFSPVGVFPAAWFGLDLEALKQGAVRALRDEDWVAQVARASIKSFQRNEWITLFWSYGAKWHHLGLWWQQLWSESLAKKNGPRVSTPVPLQGPIDQHSVLQQIVEGEKDKWIWMWKSPLDPAIRSLESPFQTDWPLNKNNLSQIVETQFLATCEALREAEVSIIQMRPQDDSMFTLGYVLMSLQLLIGTLGEVFGINAFNQPGVERGKVIAKLSLSKQNS